MSEKKRLLSDDEQTSYVITNTSYTESPHKDRFNLGYISFFILGIGLLLPWNFFINADQYFKTKLSNDPGDLKLFESAFSICSQVPCGIALMLNLYLTDRTSRKGRVLWTLVISTLCFILTTILVNINTESWTSSFFGITLTSIVIINFCSGIFQGTIFGIAGALGARYVQGTVVGLSVAGTFASIANLVSLAVGDDITVDSTVYFTIATVVTFVCIIVFILMHRLSVIRDKFQYKQIGGKSDLEESYLSSSSTDSKNESLSSGGNVAAVLKTIYPVAFSVMFIFTVSLSIMPSILSGIRSVNASNGSQWTNKYFTGVTAFLIFNLGDFTGRIIAGFVRIVDKKGPWLPILCGLRVVFIPLFILCNYQPRYHFPVVFHHDAFPVIFNVLFSVSNGYLTSLCMMYGPELVPDNMKEIAGSTMQLFLTIGLGLGAALSFLFVGII